MDFLIYYFTFSFFLLAIVFGGKTDEEWKDGGELEKLYVEHGGMLILLFILISPLVFVGKALYNTFIFLRKGI